MKLFERSPTGRPRSRYNMYYHSSYTRTNKSLLHKIQKSFPNKTINKLMIIISLIICLIFILVIISPSSTNTINNENNNTDYAAEGAIELSSTIVWDYHHLHHELINDPDGILVFCSSDINVADVAGKLFWKYFDKNPNLYILFSGGIGTGIHSGANLLGWDDPEAIVFKNRVSQSFATKNYKNIPIDRILIEPFATNSGENVDFSRKILEDQNKKFDKIILVQKPFMERRAYATMRKRWSEPAGPSVICVQSSSISWQDYYESNPVDKDTIISIMVGDLQRVKYYANPYGDFQIPQEIPDIVWKAYKFLVEKGYTKNLMPKETIEKYENVKHQ